MMGDYRVDDFAGLAGVECGECETFRATETLALDQDALAGARKTVEMLAIGNVPGSTQPCGTLLDQRAVELGHARGRRAFSRREWEHVQMGQAAFLDNSERVFK